jgi:hypothetical protein
MPRTPRVIVGCVLCGALSFLAFAEVRPATLDDAFILLVQAKHLAEHGSIYWNASDGRVDGCTSFLDLVLKAGVLRLFGHDGLRNAFELTRALQLAIPALGIALFLRMKPLGSDDRNLAAGLFAGMLLATNPAIAEGSSYLLETPLYVALGILLAGTFLATKRYTPMASAILTAEAILLSLARPEGGILAVAVLLAAALDQTKPREDRLPWAALLIFAAVMASYFAWHAVYFGEWAPNTYYAKTSASRLNEVSDGLDYVFAYARTVPGAVALAPMVALAAVAIAGNLDSARRFQVMVILGGCLALLGAVIFSGGDCYSGGRFLALPTALGAMGLVLAWTGVSGPAGRPVLAFILLLAAAQTIPVLQNVPVATKRLNEWPVADETYHCVREQAASLEAAIPGGTVAETDFQIIKYYGEDLRVLDLCGLTDREIAHRPVLDHVRWGKVDLMDVVRRRPDAFLWGTTPGRRRSMADVSMHQILTDPHTHHYFTRVEALPSPEIASGFEALYVPAAYPVCGAWFNVVIRKDLAPGFAAAGYRIGTTE